MTADEASMLDGTAGIRSDFAVVGLSPDPDRGAAREVGADAVVLQRAFVADPLGTIQRLRDMTPPRHLPDRS